MLCAVPQAFESELRNYMAVENEIGQIAAVHQIGSLSLETGPLRASLKSEAASWKAQFARNLHKQGSDDLKVHIQRHNVQADGPQITNNCSNIRLP